MSDSTFAAAKRLVPGVGSDPASANAFLALVGVGSALGWVVSYATVVLTLPPGSGPVDPKTGAWLLTGGWLVLSVLGVAVGYLRVRREVLFSAPMLAWIGLVAVGFVASAYGTASGNAALMWGAWYGVLAVGYLVTGALVTRGGVYLLAGAAAVAATAVVFFVLPQEARPHSLVLGVLGVVPVLVDAARGGRQVTDEGIPAVQAARNEGTPGGVVEAD